MSQFNKDVVPNITGLKFINFTSPIVQGRPTIIEVFATWCPPCRRMIPHIAEINKKVHGAINLVSVSTEDQATIQNLVDKTEQMKQYNVCADNGTINMLMNAHGVRGIPHAFAYNAQGSLIWQGHPAELDNIVDQLLKK